MLVFRFENARGEGVYQGLRPDLGLDWEQFDDLFCNDNHPTPTNDGMSWKDVENFHHYGFKDFDQAMSWFGEKQRSLLSKIGVTLNVYDAKGKICFGNSQLTFDMKKAVKVFSTHLVENEHALALKARITKEGCPFFK